MNEFYYIYILECADHTFYTGYTNDIYKRLKTHNEGRGAKYTRSRRPCVLVYYEKFDNKITAQKREYYIKSRLNHKDKETLVKFGRPVTYLSIDANQNLREYLQIIGREVIQFRTEGITDSRISNHPDIFMCKMVPDHGDIIFAGDDLPGEKYPDDIKFNAACTGKYFIHNLKFTSKKLLKYAIENDLILVNVKQGYAKCSTVVIDEESIITYDKGIYDSATKHGINALLISDGGVDLPGYNKGFIGGASGRVGDEIIFNGDISKHPDYIRIEKFIKSRNLKCKFFSGYNLCDIGSII